MEYLVQYACQSLIFTCSARIMVEKKNHPLGREVKYSTIGDLPLMPDIPDKVKRELISIWVPACKCFIHFVYLVPETGPGSNRPEIMLGPYLSKDDHKRLIAAQSRTEEPAPIAAPLS